MPPADYDHDVEPSKAALLKDKEKPPLWRTVLILCVVHAVIIGYISYVTYRYITTSKINCNI
jgi:uncharacterized protein (DUF2062 family)